MNVQPKLLSIIAHGRNDNYGQNFLWRFSTSINKFTQTLFDLNVQDEVEIIIIDCSKYRDELHSLRVDL